MKQNYLSVSEAAKRKDVSRSAIYKAIESGRLKSFILVGKIALRESEVERWQPAPSPGRRKGVKLSAESRAKMAESQRRRWQNANR